MTDTSEETRSTPLLQVRGLHSGYDGSTVLHGADLDVAEGTVVALLGRNGAGKTTLVHTVMGLLRPYTGSVRIAGREMAGRRPDLVARTGVGLVPQGRRVFAPLTVHEHLHMTGASRAGVWDAERVLELLPRLADRSRNRGDQLSGGEQQMLAIARALLTNPRLMLLDEPSDGLAPAIVSQVGDVVRESRDSGISVLLVEQDLRLVFSVADRIAVLDKGRIVLETTTEDFRSDEARAKALLGVG